MEESKTLMKKEPIDNKVVTEFLFSSGTKLTDQQKKLFIAISIRNQLDPFKREIHPVPYRKEDGSYGLSIVTGYEVYLKRAELSGKLDGWKVWTEGKISDGTLKACIEIKRKDWSQPLVHEVFFTEYNLGRSLWKSKPLTMVKKVVIAQGFRLAFPEELGGMPYTADELSESSEAIDITPMEPEVQIEQNGEQSVGQWMTKGEEDAPHSPPPSEPITEKQIGMIFGIGKNQLKLTEDQIKHRAFEIVRRPVESLKSLSRAEASELIKAFQAERDKR